VTIHARRTTAAFAPPKQPVDDMFFDDVKTLYDLEQPAANRIRVEQTYSDYRKGDKARLDSLAYLPLQELRVVDLDTARPLTTVKEGTVAAKLDVPIVDDRQSAHLRLTGVLVDPTYRLDGAGDLVFKRTLKGLRNTILLPEGWEISEVSQSGTIGTYNRRAFVALINLNAENQYTVQIRARKR
jgi:hypothetical protein